VGFKDLWNYFGTFGRAIASRHPASRDVNALKKALERVELIPQITINNVIATLKTH
jgi:hypothetical protein